MLNTQSRLHAMRLWFDLLLGNFHSEFKTHVYVCKWMWLTAWMLQTTRRMNHHIYAPTNVRFLICESHRRRERLYDHCALVRFRIHYLLCGRYRESFTRFNTMKGRLLSHSEFDTGTSDRQQVWRNCLYAYQIFNHTFTNIQMENVKTMSFS